MNFDRTQQELLAYCKENKIWRNFIPIAEFLLLIIVVLGVIDNFVDFGIFSTFIAILRYVAIVMVLAKANYKVLTIGFGILTIDELLYLIMHLISSRPHFYASYLIWAVVYALLALSAFKKSGMTVNELKSSVTSKEGIKQSMNIDEAKQFNMHNMAEDIKSTSKNVAEQAKDIRNQVKQQPQQTENISEE